jgi:catechol 2,3-dioxygenase-like lactoylglutathione lyase family enzyme
MLGRFLEYSVITDDIQASLDFYRKIGFSQAQVGDAWAQPYAVVTDGRICLGLHQESRPGPLITFVKPDLGKHLPEFARLGVEFDVCRLGDHVFNEIAWSDPSGHAIRLVEARTFSPVKRTLTETSQCGYFLEIALPAADVEAAKIYWEQFGFVGMDEPDAPVPHVSCTSDTIDVGLYETARLSAPTLAFEAGNLAGRLEALADLGVHAAEARGVSSHGAQTQGAKFHGSGRAMRAVSFTAPEGTSILLSQAD